MLFGNPQSAEAKMKALGKAYGAALPGKLLELEAAAQPLSGGGKFEDVRQSLHDTGAAAHKIAGTAGTFGYQEITDQARAIEKSVRAAIAAGQPLTERQAADIESQIAALKALGDALCGAATRPDAPFGIPSSAQAQLEFAILLAPPGDETEALAGQIEELGCPVRRMSDLADESAIGADANIRAILVHTALPQGNQMCRQLIERFRRQHRAHVPIVHLSHTGDFRARLQAVRAGSAAFVTGPLNATAIVEKIEEASAAASFTPYRVLVVEDDDVLAAQCASAFAGSGYSARRIKEPAELLDRLQTFDTELIVMDLSVSGVGGLELAKVVWQHEDHRNIAILFLTPGPEFNVQLLKMGVSDEFFIPRPIDAHALCAIAARYLGEIRGGRRPPNFSDLSHHLDRITQLKASNGKTASRGKGEDHAGAATGPDGAAKALPKVLVVDDDRHLVDAMAVKLAESGFEVLRAFSGEQGFRVAWEERPDAIVTDYAMPDGSGDYLLSRLKSAENTRDIPVMVLTAHTLDGERDFALERDFLGRLGAVSYLSKPIGLETLAAEVGRLVRSPPGETT